MLKKFLTVVFVLAGISVSVMAEGYEVSYSVSQADKGVEGKGSYQIALIKKTSSGNMSLADAIASVNSYMPQAGDSPVYMMRIAGDVTGEDAALSAIGKEKVDLSMVTGMKDFSVFADNTAVKYVILPNNTAKENVDAVGKDVDAAVAAAAEYTYSDGWQYVDPNTDENVMTASCSAKEFGGVTYVNLKGTGVYKTAPTAVEAIYTKADGTKYVVSDATPVLFKEGNAYGVNAGTVLSALTSDTYYIYNGQNRYDGSLFREENGMMYGNTGTAIDLLSVAGAYVYIKDDKTFVYTEADVYSRGEKIYGLIGGKESVVELKKNIEYRTYGVNGAVADVSKYTIIGDPITEWGNTYYNTKEGVSLFVVCVYTYGSEQTKYEGEVFAFGGKYYGYIGDNPFAELTKTADDTNTFYSKFAKEVYTGKLYDSEQGTYLGGTGEDVMLTSVTDYYIAETKYDGPVTEDNKGVADWSANCFQLATSYVHTYTDLAGKEKTLKSSSKLDEIDMTDTYDDLWIAAEACKIPSEAATSVALTAYVSTPGALRNALARWELLNNRSNVANNGWTYTVNAVSSLTLSGSVNAADISNGDDCLTTEGNAYVWQNGALALPEGKSHTANPIAAMTGGMLRHIDLQDAVFATQTDMNFTLLNASDLLETVVLPVNEKMNMIPAGAFNNVHKVSELCIPYNYEIIGAEAFCYTHALMHIYTTDPVDGTAVDNGLYTYTFSANLKEIQSSGNQSTFFGDDIEKITDIYNLAVKAPKCGAGAFATSMTHCNGGFAGNWKHPICRDNYRNTEKRVMCILHYPAACVEEEAGNYTDVTRVYTLADETGAVYADGSPVMWPRHNEFLRSYSQALNGVTWDAWQAYETDGSWAAEVIASLDAAQKYPIDAAKVYNQADYQGWHEFVLARHDSRQAFIPQTENTEYVQRDWLTICVPYDLRKSQLLDILGVKGSEGTRKIKMIDGSENVVNDDVYPDVRTLTQVSRSVNNGKMTLHISKPLANDEEGRSWAVKLLDDAQGFNYVALTDDDPVVVRGGHPYLIRAYVPAKLDSSIKNLGMYIMAAAQSANQAASEKGEKDNLPYRFNEESVVENIMLPCVKHDIQALNADAPATHSLYEDAAQKDARYVYKDEGRTMPALYHFIGTYTTSKIPQYAYYIGKAKDGKHKFSRTTKTGDKAYTWAPYSAVIVGLSAPEYKGLDTTGTSEALQNITIEAHNANDLVILAGETSNQSLAGKPLSIMMDENNDGMTATNITDVKAEADVKADGKVYALNGQLVGKSADVMRKGVYVINGTKKIVR